MDNVAILANTQPLTVDEKQKLNHLESVIRQGQQLFYEVGMALLTIRDERLYRETHSTFEEYCQAVWGFSASHGYNYITTALIVADLETEEKPQLPYHASKLAILPPENRTSAWAEVLATHRNEGVPISGDLVATVAKKHYVQLVNPTLYEQVAAKAVTPGKAYETQKALENLPNYYIAATFKYSAGGIVDAAALQAIRMLEYEFPEEAEAILQSGYLDDTYTPIALVDLTERDVVRHLKRLRFEAREQTQSRKARQQNSGLSKPAKLVVSGVEAVEAIAAVGSGGIVIFPEEFLTATELGVLLDKSEFTILAVVAYRGDNVTLETPEGPVRLGDFGGKKPKVFTNFVDNLQFSTIDNNE